MKSGADDQLPIAIIEFLRLNFFFPSAYVQGSHFLTNIFNIDLYSISRTIEHFADKNEAFICYLELKT